MTPELKQAIERLREGDYVRRFGQIVALTKERQDILAVCAAAEKAMRVVEAAKDLQKIQDQYNSGVKWSLDMYKRTCDLADQKRKEIRAALAAMEDK